MTLELIEVFYATLNWIELAPLCNMCFRIFEFRDVSCM
jgi:hypothetical protein